MTRVAISGALACLLLVGSVSAEEQTVTLAVEGMWCAGCSYIVKQSLVAVPGVQTVAVSGQEKTAVVTFDDQETTVTALTDATAAMGFPSAPKE